MSFSPSPPIPHPQVVAVRRISYGLGVGDTVCCLCLPSLWLDGSSRRSYLVHSFLPARLGRGPRQEEGEKEAAISWCERSKATFSCTQKSRSVPPIKSSLSEAQRAKL